MGVYRSAKLRVLQLSAGAAMALVPSDGILNDVQSRFAFLADQLGALVYVIRTLQTPGIGEWKQRRFRVYPTRSRSKLAQVPDMLVKAARLCREECFDLIGVQTPFDLGFVGLLLARRHGIPLIVDLHADFLGNPHWLAERPRNRLLHALGTYVIRRADGVRAVGKQIAENVQRMGIDGQSILYMPTGGGIDMRPYLSQHQRTDEVRREALGKDGNYLIIGVGRLVPQKDMETWLQVAARVVKTQRRARFVVLGDGPQRQDLERLSRSLGLGEAACFVGRIPYEDIPAWMQAADLLLLTSIYEGAARVLMEAAAASRPIVTTAVSGARDIVVDGETGFVVPIGGALVAANAVLRLLANESLRVDMGRAGHIRAMERFDRQKNWPGMLDIWQSVVDNYRNRLRVARR